MWKGLVVWAIVFGWSMVAMGQPLADKVPADALVYVGWSGTSAMPPGYGESHLKEVLDASDARYLLERTLPSLIQRVARDDARSATILRLAQDLSTSLLRYPSAFYFGGVDFPNAGQPVPHAALLCQAGTEADALVQKLQPLLAQANEVPFPLNVSNHQGLVVVRLGQTPRLDQLISGAGGQDARALKDDPRFVQAMKNIRFAPVAVAYMDAKGVAATISDAAAQSGSPTAKARWSHIAKMLGLDGLQWAIYAGGFEGRDWTTQVHLEAPEPREGLLATLAGPPLDEQILKLVPRSATLVSASRMDLSRSWSAIQQIMIALNPSMTKGLVEMQMQLQRNAGADVLSDLLGALGDQWLYYRDPTTGGPGLASGVLVSPARDAQKLEDALTRLEQAAQKSLDEFMRRAPVKVRFRQTQAHGATIHYLAIPLVAPAWTVHDGKLYAALYPQIVASAIAHDQGQGSILDNPAFVAWRERFGSVQPTELAYFDLPALAPGGYSSLLIVSRLVLGVGDLFEVDAPAMLPVPLDVLMKHLGTAGTIQWADAQGIHFRTVSPFPGADMLALDGVESTIVQQSLLISIMLPSLNRSRETANRVKCASNMRQLGQSFLLYSNENRGNLPPDLGTALKTQDVGMAVFVCPSSGNALPENWRSMSIDQQADWVNQNSSYVYLGKGRKNDMPPDEVVLYEHQGNHDHDGINLLYGDGHVEFQSLFVAGQEIEKATGQNPFIDGAQ